MKYLSILVVIIMIQFSFASMQKGRIGGNIIDHKTQQAIVGANVVIEGTLMGAASDVDGNFIILNLAPGSYNLSIHYLGYRTIMKSNVIVNPKSTTVLNIKMETDIMESESIEVTASYFQKPVDAVASSRSVDMEEIRRAPGSNLDIQRVMQSLPAVVSASDQNNEIIIRGGNPGENLFLLDDIEIPNPNHFSQQGSGGGPINIINTMMVREVDFYAGAFPAKYGDKASSVMDISLREGSREGFQTQMDMGMAGIGLLVEGPLSSGKGSYVFSARKSYLDLLAGSFGLTAIPKYWNAQGKLMYDLNKNNTIIVNALYGEDAINIEDEGTGGYSQGAENVDTDGNQFAVGTTLRTMWNKSLYSKTTLSAIGSNWNVDVYRFNNNKKDTYFTNKSKLNEIAFKTDFGYKISDKDELSFGAFYKKIGNNPELWAKADTIFIYDVDGGNPDTKIGIRQIIKPSYSENSISPNKFGAYAHYSGALLKKLHYNFGLRYQYYDLNDFHTISPRVGLSWYFDPKTTLSIAYGKHFQSPDALYFSLNPENEKVKNYSTEQIVLGFEKIFRNDIKFTVETYYKQYDKVPVMKRHTTSDPFDYYNNLAVNSGEGRAYGVELFLQKKLTENFSTIISYSWSKSEALDLRTDKYYDWDYDYGNVFTFIGGYKIHYHKKDWFQKMKKTLWYQILAPVIPINDEIEWSIKYRYLGGRPYTPKTYHPEYKQWIVNETDDFNSERLPQYSRLDLRLDRRFFFDSWNFVNYFDISNILNHKNIWEYQYNHEEGTKEEVLQFEPFFVGGFIIEF
jgi:hypothetical protein